jgi:choice-of-anchor B domain-containing protein
MRLLVVFACLATLAFANEVCNAKNGIRDVCLEGQTCNQELGCRGPAPECLGSCAIPDYGSRMPTVMKHKMANREKCEASGYCAQLASSESIVGAKVPCVGGLAAGYPCLNVDLLSYVNLKDLGAGNGNGNDIWGIEIDGREFAIAGCTTGTSFIEITDPVNPVVLGWMATQSTASTWRDIKVYKEYAYIVSEARDHGMQVFNLRRLLTAKPNTIFTADLKYIDGMGTATQRSTHNIAINEETGYAYLVGCKTCAGGLLVVDLADPANPKYAGCFSADGYTHDTQCVIYRGPDGRYKGKEICFAYNEDSFTIVDVTNKANMVMVSRMPYYGVSYTHQGWVREQQDFAFLDDELDEMYETYDTTGKTVTYGWNVTDLQNPRNVWQFQSPVASIDHNMYVEGDLIFQSNYASGLRVLSGVNTLDRDVNTLKLAGYFDVHPDGNVVEFYGTWSNFPYFKSAVNKNTIVVQSIEKGLFVVSYDKAAAALA